MPPKATVSLLGSTKRQQPAKRRGKHFWRKVIKDCDNSSLSVKDFCAERSLAVSTFYGWHCRLFPGKSLTHNPQKQKKESQAAFVPLYIRSSDKVPQDLKTASTPVLSSLNSVVPKPSGLSMMINERIQINIDQSFHEPTLQRLIQIFTTKEVSSC